ncbi:MAG: HEAT repeat domain-containing protein, partial [Bacteroidaceae bacterium]|nr:HEAT repeat domain-containing protein [Bacteroidaceae bacterium]
RTTRNYNYHILVPKELEYLSNPDNPVLQTIMWEALGWYVTSYQAHAIAELALKVSADTRFDETVRNEALKTYNRVK